MRAMPEKFARYDVTDYLKTDEDIAYFLEASFEEAGDDAAFIAAALGEVARAYGMAKLARKTGLTREALYRALSKKGNPSFASVLKVLGAMGLQLAPKIAKPTRKAA